MSYNNYISESWRNVIQSTGILKLRVPDFLTIQSYARYLLPGILFNSIEKVKYYIQLELGKKKENIFLRNNFYFIMPIEYSGDLFFSFGKNFNTCLIHKQSTDCLAWKNFPSFSAFYTPLLNSDRWKLAEQGIYGKANTNFNERETSNKFAFTQG